MYFYPNVPDTAKNALIKKMINNWIVSTIDDPASIEFTPGMAKNLD